MWKFPTAFNFVSVGLLALAVIICLTGCASPTPTPWPTETPTPTPRPDEEILTLATIFADKDISDRAMRRWQHLLFNFMDSYAQEKDTNFSINLESRFVHREDGHHPWTTRRYDVVWWLDKAGSSDHLDNIKTAAEYRSSYLRKGKPEVLEWVSGGGVLIYSGTVHPAGLREEFFPYRIKFELHELGEGPVPVTTFTRMGWRALEGDDSWPEFVITSFADVGSGTERRRFITTYGDLSGEWEVWGMTDGSPSIVAAEYGDGWIILAQTSFGIPYGEQAKVAAGLLRAAYNRIDGKVPSDSASPPGVNARVIEEVNEILEDAESGVITESEAQWELDRISNNIGKKALTWIVSNAPVFDRETQQFTRFEDYAKGLKSPRDPENPSRLDEDPVGTAVDIFFGETDPDTIAEWLGFDDE